MDELDHVPELASVDELDELLRGDPRVSRGLRRRVLSDARGFVRRLVDVDGVPAGSVRFRLICCVDCGVLELRAKGDVRRVCH